MDGGDEHGELSDGPAILSARKWYPIPGECQVKYWPWCGSSAQSARDCHGVFASDSNHLKSSSESRLQPGSGRQFRGHPVMTIAATGVAFWFALDPRSSQGLTSNRRGMAFVSDAATSASLTENLWGEVQRCSTS